MSMNINSFLKAMNGAMSSGTIAMSPEMLANALKLAAEGVPGESGPADFLSIAAFGDEANEETNKADDDGKTGKAADSGEPEAARPEDYEQFSKTFNTETLAGMLGLDPKNLTDKQSDQLTQLLYGINVANKEKEANGEAPMTKDEINQYIKGELEKFNNGEESEIGQTLSELGIEELTDEQYDNIIKALDEFNKGQAAEETKEPEQKPQETKEAGGDGGSPSATGSDGVGKTNPSNTNNPANAADKGNDAKTGQADEAGLPADLNQLQDMKSKAEGELGELNGQIDAKQGEINDRRKEVIDESLGEEIAEEDAVLTQKYQEAQEEYKTASQAKAEAQGNLTQAEQDACAAEQSLYANVQNKQQVSADLSAARNELASLQPPAKPSGDDPDAQAAYQAELEAYNSQKNALETKISGLEQQKQQLEAEYQRLQNEKAQTAKNKADAQAEVAAQDEAMQAAQTKMDEAAEALSEGHAEIKEALEKDEKLQSLQNELDELKQKKADKEAEISALDSRIAEVEQTDEGVQEMREEEADQAFRNSAIEAGYDVEGLTADSQEAVAQEKYGKSYGELTDEEKVAIEAEIDGAVTIEVMDQARDMLKEDPNNEAALGVLEKGQVNLDTQQDLSFARLNDSMANIPASLRSGASEAMQAAIQKAEEDGTDANAAAAAALAQYASDNIENADLSDEEKAAVLEISGDAAGYAKAIDNTRTGVDILKDAGYEVDDADANAVNTETAALLNHVAGKKMSEAEYTAYVNDILERQKGCRPLKGRETLYGVIAKQEGISEEDAKAMVRERLDEVKQNYSGADAACMSILTLMDLAADYGVKMQYTHASTPSHMASDIDPAGSGADCCNLVSWAIDQATEKAFPSMNVGQLGLAYKGGLQLPHNSDYASWNPGDIVTNGSEHAMMLVSNDPASGKIIIAEGSSKDNGIRLRELTYEQARKLGYTGVDTSSVYDGNF